MKKILIMLNLVLAGIVGILVLSNLTLKVKNENAAPKSKKVQKSSSVKNKKTLENKAGAVEERTLKTPDEAFSVIVEEDVFNQIRSPLANVRVGQGDMTLVGVVAGKAAIVKNNARNRQYNPYLAQAQRMSASMNGRPAGRFTQWSQMSGRNAGPARQYVRVGETTSTGYTLAEVSRTRAVFVRGNDKLELELQDPSKNRAAARQANRRLSQTQQFQQAQMFMQSQMIRTMRDIQRNSSSNRAPQGNRNRR